MSDIIKQDLRDKIAENLLLGKTPEQTANKLNCDIFSVFEVLRSEKFRANLTDQLAANVQSASLTAFRNIILISQNKKASDATRLKACQYIVDKATEEKAINKGNATPSTMTQEELAKAYEAFEAEILKRAKHIDIKTIPNDIEDLL